VTDTRHHLITTYALAADCPHLDPEQDKRFEDAFEGLTYDDQKAHPLWNDYQTASDAYTESHPGSPMGDLCHEMQYEGCLVCGEPVENHQSIGGRLVALISDKLAKPKPSDSSSTGGQL